MSAITGTACIVAGRRLAASAQHAEADPLDAREVPGAIADHEQSAVTAGAKPAPGDAAVEDDRVRSRRDGLADRADLLVGRAAALPQQPPELREAACLPAQRAQALPRQRHAAALAADPDLQTLHLLLDRELGHAGLARGERERGALAGRERRIADTQLARDRRGRVRSTAR